jgi:hypothetical protein
MKISDLIGDLAQLFGNQMPSGAQYTTMDVANGPDLQLAEPELVDQADQETMVPPLQQKIELLKKAVDVDSFYDDEESTTPKQTSQAVNLTLNVPPGESSTRIELTVNGSEPDELDQIKQLAGVPVAAVFDAGDDEPLDS